MKKLGIDYGQKRIGLAISDELETFATPLLALKVKSFADALTKLQRIIKRLKVDEIIIGLPLSMKGNETKQSIQTRYFANALKSTNGSRIKFRNESFSTKEAEQNLKKSSKKSKEKKDSEAARIILQEYLDSKKDPFVKESFILQYNLSNPKFI